MDNLIKLGRKVSAKSGHNIFQHCAILLRGGNIIATGTNHASLHAEWRCLMQAWPSERRGTTLISLRFTRAGVLANAQPCPKCARLIIESGVKTIKYSVTNGAIITQRVKDGFDYTGTKYANIDMDTLRPIGSGAKYYGMAPFGLSSAK